MLIWQPHLKYLDSVIDNAIMNFSANSRVNLGTLLRQKSYITRLHITNNYNYSVNGIVPILNQ